MTLSASDLQVLDEYRSILSERFGYPELREAQTRVLAALQQSDVFAVSPTGSGKSMSYVLPALSRGKVLVVSPHIALMQDQVESLQANGVPASFVNSTLTRSEKNRNYSGFVRGEIRLLYTSPESLANEKLVAGLARHGLNLLAIDEAHCVSEWGHTFRPEYLRLKDVRVALGEPRTLALTATATPLAREDIVNRLGLTQAEQIVTSVARDNLRFSVERAHSNEQKDELLAQFALARKGRSGIVYVGARKRTEQLAEMLRDRGLSAASYHAGLDASTRRSTQRSFMTDDVDVIVATNAFGLGVDKPDVRYVVHYDMPARLEAYYQEAGRAGRDGEPAECMLIHTRWSKQAPEFFIDRDHPTEDQVRSYWLELLAQPAPGDEAAPADDGRNDDGRVMAIRALQESGLLDSDGLTPLSGDSYPRIKTDAITRHRRYAENMLERMAEFATTRQCRLGVVLKYFGEPGTQRCGQCDNCRARTSRSRTGRSGSSSAASAERSSTGPRLAPVEPIAATDPDRDLFDALRRWRRQRAETDGVPAFMVFSDRVLIELARRKPKDMVRFSDVPGVGSVKRDRYGSELLRLIIDHTG